MKLASSKSIKLTFLSPFNAAQAQASAHSYRLHLHFSKYSPSLPACHHGRHHSLKVLAGVAAFLAIVNASPAKIVPSDESDSIPQEFIDGVLAYFKAQPVNGTSKRDVENALHKRVPAEHGCNHDDHWFMRSCLSDVGPRQFQDRCQDEHGNPYDVDGICLEFTYCSAVIEQENGHEIHDIICIPATPPKEDNVRTNGKKGQYGYRTVEAVSQRGVTELEKSIRLQEDIPGASVSGHVRSKCIPPLWNPCLH